MERPVHKTDKFLQVLEEEERIRLKRLKAEKGVCFRTEQTTTGRGGWSTGRSWCTIWRHEKLSRSHRVQETDICAQQLLLQEVGAQRLSLLLMQQIQEVGRQSTKQVRVRQGMRIVGEILWNWAKRGNYLVWSPICIRLTSVRRSEIVVAGTWGGRTSAKFATKNG